MDHALDRAEGMIANRIAALLRAMVELARVGHELPRDRVMRVATVDGVRHNRCDGDRIARGHFGKPAEARARHQSLRTKLVDAAQDRGR